jgi:hypothetical protein
LHERLLATKIRAMQFTPAGPVSLLAFLAVDVAVLAMFLRGVYVGSRRAGREPAQVTRRVALGTATWMLLLAGTVASGVIESAPMPALPIFLAVALGGALLLALSRVGAWLSQVPLAALVAFQGFRLPLELVLHSWADGGTIPRTMTWDGSNVDILSGIVALLAAPLVPRLRAAAWAANVVGAVLLLNVVRVAVMSSPVPFGWQVEPPLLLAMHVPYASIVPICVGGALAGHVVLTRALLRPATSRPPA